MTFTFMTLERAIDLERAARERGHKPCCIANTERIPNGYEPCGERLPCWRHIDQGDLAAPTGDDSE